MSLQELLDEIPTDELKQFEKFLRVGKAGDVIISEGTPNDNALYLLRAGRVGVFRKVNGIQERVSEIDANGFFGEMEVMEEEGYRSATCSVISEYAIYYGFKNVDIKTLVKNPLWAQTLITRLCQDLHLFADRIVNLEEKYKELGNELDYSRQQSALLLSALDSLHQNVACHLVMSNKDWVYVKGVNEMIKRYVSIRLPDVHNRATELNCDALKEIDDEGLLPKKLKSLFPG